MAALVSFANHRPEEGQQLELFQARPGPMALRDAQDLMSYPFFSLAKSPRVKPIDFRMGEIIILVEATRGHGIATIWDADVLIWAASQIVDARNNGLKTSRHMAATPYEILTTIGRGTSARDYRALKAALNRLQSTIVATSIRPPLPTPQIGDLPPQERPPETSLGMQRFSWIEEWKSRIDPHGRQQGLELTLPDWFYAGVMADDVVLTIDRAYFDLTGGLERWLYRLVRKHGGRQKHGWSFDFRHLHSKSGSLSPFRRFAFDLRDIVRRQRLPGYQLAIKVDSSGRSLLKFKPARADPKVRRAAYRQLQA